MLLALLRVNNLHIDITGIRTLVSGKFFYNDTLLRIINYRRFSISKADRALIQIANVSTQTDPFY